METELNCFHDHKQCVRDAGGRNIHESTFVASQDQFHLSLPIITVKDCFSIISTDQQIQGILSAVGSMALEMSGSLKSSKFVERKIAIAFIRIEE